MRKAPLFYGLNSGQAAIGPFQEFYAKNIDYI